MPYQQGIRLPGERASRISHIDLLQNKLINEVIKKFELSETNLQPLHPHWLALPSNSRALPYVFAVDGSYQIITIDEPHFWKVAFIKTALLMLDQNALSKIDKDAPHPLQLRDILSKSAVYHGAVFPLKNINYSGKSIYHAIRQNIYDFIQDKSSPLFGEPMESLKWIVYKKWKNNQEGLPRFQCPHCEEIVATLPYNSEIGNCPVCKEQIFITDMLGFHQEMAEDFAPDQLASNYMNVHELLLLFTGIRYFWQTNKDVLENSLFVKDGPLMMPSQYSKLVEPIRQFIEFAQNKGYNINIVGQEKSGAFFEHLQLIGKDAPLKTMFIPNDSYIKEEIQQRPKKPFQYLYGEKTNYGAKVFVKLNNYHQMILNIPTGRFNPNPHISDLIGIDRICSTLETILSYRYEGALLPIELVHGTASLSTYPSAEILKIFAKASTGS
jgi:hypothetical protein